MNIKKELKLTLPLYKIAYAISFIVILCLVRGVSISYEVGIATEPMLAMLAAAFCSDTYTQEIASGRSEVLRLFPLKKRTCFVLKRMILQGLFLLMLGAAGYGLFFLFQKPLLFSVMQPGAIGEAVQFFLFLIAAAVTIAFWGTLSNTLACLFRNPWAGIGASLVLWLLTNSASANRLLGSWNLFSYSFRKISGGNDLSWLYGKAVCIVLCLAMTAALPRLLKKR